MSRVETVHLPFNFSSIKDNFTFSKNVTNNMPPHGFSVVLQEANLVVHQKNDCYIIPEDYELPNYLKPSNETVCIGFWQGKAVRVYTLPATVKIFAPYFLEPFNNTNDHLDSATLTLAGLAKSILHWHNSSLFCSKCGAKTEYLNISFGKKCTICGTQHFPHLHPCAIILVKRGNEVLLTRKKEWAAGRYGLVAGFLEFSESLEECAKREVLEETGIIIKNIRYVGSQNWPFPAQMMAGFVAEYDTGEIVVDYNELEDAAWFKTDELPELPGKLSIARWIIDNFA